ncbi:MAG TPA: thiamine pyrophosphate-dependent dehydrogenase E1 component subunit alpha [Acidimicrobiia bacterium]|nr:thiamine pyrophosphate-dependent dehydrogenase E1 component subunit alpha [Acidimicrobiia bacterium]
MAATQTDSVPRLDIWRSAQQIRIVDETMRGLMNAGTFGGMYYSPCGQEVLAAAVGAALRPDDYAVTTYRGLHDQLAKGVPLESILAEYFGKGTGACGGKGGPMHVTDPSVGLMLTTGIVGGGLPVAVGLALGARLERSSRFCAVNFGDGAANIGAFHEALNLAAVWDLPVVFVCQNNDFGEYTPRHESTRVEIAARAAAYGMPGIEVDGNDAAGVWSAATAAVARARAGEGPTLLDCKTYRLMGHFYGDQMPYMDRDELARRMADHPVDRLRAEVLATGAADERTLEALDAELRAQINEAFDAAQAASPADPSGLMTDIYAEVNR